jgi:hypothetical protein
MKPSGTSISKMTLINQAYDFYITDSLGKFEVVTHFGNLSHKLTGMILLSAQTLLSIDLNLLLLYLSQPA